MHWKAAMDFSMQNLIFKYKMWNWKHFVNVLKINL